MDKRKIAARIRKRLEERISFILDCEPHELHGQRIGSLIHLAFLLEGPSENIGGFHSTMNVVLDLLGSEIVWNINNAEKATDEVVEDKAVVN